MGKLVFITGGARSGKSSLALELASEAGPRRAFVATAEPLDAEMSERIRRHREDRGSGWDTFEEPVNISERLTAIMDKYDAVVLDCLTLWLSNLLGSTEDPEARINEFINTLLQKSVRHSTLIVVSNELGMGVVPVNAEARAFRDRAGELNKAVAAIADEAYITVSGIPVRIKGEDT